jgi:cation transport regulator ChaC
VIAHFAYGSNMSRAVMHKHAPDAEPVGATALADHGFVITADGYASIAPKRGVTVHGVLWRLTPRDRVTLDAWENVAAGLYRAVTMPVQHAGQLQPALIYVAQLRQPGQARAGYMELVIAAAVEWQLPEAYIQSLRDWLPRGPAGQGELKEFRWT